jgi:hypothetical protein
MRQFTPWAEAVGGFLTHHAVPGFLGNVETVRDIDEEESAWTAFFAQWRKIHGDKWLTSNDLRLSANIATDAVGRPYDRWEGLFRADGRGQSVSIKSLGKLLTGQIDRYRGSYVLRSEQDKHSKVRTWRVEEWSGLTRELHPAKPANPAAVRYGQVRSQKGLRSLGLREIVKPRTPRALRVMPAGPRGLRNTASVPVNAGQHRCCGVCGLCGVTFSPRV